MQNLLNHVFWVNLLHSETIIKLARNRKVGQFCYKVVQVLQKGVIITK